MELKSKLNKNIKNLNHVYFELAKSF